MVKTRRWRENGPMGRERHCVARTHFVRERDVVARTGVARERIFDARRFLVTKKYLYVKIIKTFFGG